MFTKSWIRNLFSFQSPLSSKKAKPFTQLNLLCLEERIVPAVPFSPAFPQVLSITPATDNSAPLAGTTAAFTVTFNSPVTGVDADDFKAIITDQVVVGSLAVTGSGSIYSVTVSDVKGEGTLGVNLVDAPTISAAVSFAPQNAFSTGSGSKPNSVTMGDVNGDGRLDIVTANAGKNNVSVMLGNGNGTFAGQNTFAVGSDPYSVTLGDVDGDGKLDIVTVNLIGQTASVLLGNGDGAFKGQTTFWVDSWAKFVKLGDVNGDGCLDIVAAIHNGGAGMVRVLLGNGNGAFGPLQNFATGNFTFSLTLGDVNRDGRVDIVTANDNDNTASVLLGNGDGTFGAHTTFAVGRLPFSVTLGDVNGDGRLDIVTANLSSNNASVLLGNGNGTFGDHIDFDAGSPPFSVTLGDVNGDGKLDIVMVNLFSFSDIFNATVLLGNGNGTFGGQTSFEVGAYPVSLTLGDVNSDGRLDIVTANRDDDTVGLLLGKGVSAPTVAFTNVALSGKAHSPKSVAEGDVNGDGKLDIVTANATSRAATVLLGNGNGTFQSQNNFATDGVPFSLKLGDVNGDGNLDIVTANPQSNTVSVLLGHGNGAFGGHTDLGVGGNPYSVAVGDVNRDGKLDIIAANRRDGTVSVLLGYGNGSFGGQTIFAVGVSPGSVVLGDVNGDGRLDVVTANYGSSTASVLLGNGNGTFASQTTFPVGVLPYSVALGDVNGDGKLDIVTASSIKNTVSVLLGNGNGTFASQTTFAVGIRPFSVTVGDVNGDGQLDIVTANFDGKSTSVLLGNGNGTFASQTTFAVGNLPDSVMLGDVNGDGRLDIVTGNFGSGTASVLLNSLAFTGQRRTYPINHPYAPTITSSKTAFFPQGLAGAFTVTATPGFPAATTFSITAGELPPGLSLGSATGVISGVAEFEVTRRTFTNVPIYRSYIVDITASNGIFPDAVQTITLKERQVPVGLRVSVPPKVTPPVGTEVALSVGTEVTLRDPVTGNATKTITPFPGFSGEVRVAIGDTTGDGNLETILSAGPGGGPAIVVVNSTTGETMSSFFAYDPAFTGGVFVATLDVNKDGSLDIVTGAGEGGGPHVKVFNRGTNESILEFFAYDTAFLGGVTVACADINNDGVLEIVTGAGPGGAPHVKVFDGATGAMISQWFAYDSSFRGGVFVAVADLDNDGNFEVITGAGEGGAPVVAIWNALNGSLINQFLAYDPEFRGGVRVGITDVNLDGDLELVTGPGPGGSPHIKVFEYPELNLLFSFFNGDPENRDGVFVS